MALFRSKPERVQRVSTLRPDQENLFSQLQSALAGQGAGGAFGDVADYYRNLLSGGGTSEFEAPLLRQFREEIMPGIAEQFAGMGSGALSSGNFLQEQGRAATDLAERLGSIRAGLRQQGASALSGLAQQGLSPIDELVFRPRKAGLFEQFTSSLLPGLGTALGTSLGSPLSSGLSGMASKLFGNFLEK